MSRSWIADRTPPIEPCERGAVVRHELEVPASARISVLTPNCGSFTVSARSPEGGDGQEGRRIARVKVVQRFTDSGRAFAVTLRSRNLRRAMLNFGAAWTAEWAFMVALGVVAFRHGGPTAVGVVGFIRIAPATVIAPLGSTLGDRFRRDRVLVWSCVVRAAATAAAAVALAAEVSMAAVYALAVVATAAFTVVRPVHSALLPLLCSTPLELTSANAVRGLLDSLATFFGPLIAALLLGFSGAEAVFWVAAALSLLAALLVLRLDYEAPPRRRTQRLSAVVGETVDGFRTIFRDRKVGAVVWVGVAQVFTRGCLNVFLVVIALELLETDDAGVGVLTAAIGAGAIVGSLGVAVLVSGRRLAALEGIGVALWGLPLVMTAVFPNRGAVIALMCVIGVGNALIDVGLFTLIPRFVPEHTLTRVFGALESLLTCALAIGSLVAPVVIAWIDVRGALVVLGLVAPTSVVVWWRRLRAVDATVVARDADIEMLRRVSMFRPLSMPVVESLALAVEEVAVAAGTQVITQGEPGDFYYLITSGAADVFGDDKLIRTMGPGDAFGEIALLRQGPRTATVRATTPLSLYRLNRNQFLTAVGGSNSSRSSADELIDDRLATFRPTAEGGT